MKINNLSLRQFRKTTSADLSFSSGVNFFLGQNGEGKTTVLEAISLLTTLRSFRTTRFDEMIQFGTRRSELKAEIEFSGLTHQAQMSFLQNEKRVSKEILLNGKMMKTSSQYLNTRFGAVECGFHSIAFNPSDHDLVRGEPAERRSFLDRALAAADLDYFTSLTRFKKALEIRNALLKQNASQTQVHSFTEIFVTEGAKITLTRLSWIEKINPLLREFAEKIALNSLPYEIILRSNWISENREKSIYSEGLTPDNFSGQCYSERLEFFKKRLVQRLEETKSTEREAKSTLVGPHRDDWLFQFGSHSLKAVGSQGEVRTALLALKLSEIELFRNKTGGDPILLLDDFSSELDGRRRKALLQFLAETPLQVFVTSTELPLDLSFGKVFQVQDGMFEMGLSG